jgi:DNA-binding SARP family transcriptional activator
MERPAIQALPGDYRASATKAATGYVLCAMLEFRILGPLEVVGGDGPIPLGGAKQRATLAILLLSANRVVSVERLADDLYSGAAPVTAVTQVQRQVSELRKALGPDCGVETRSPGYVMMLDPDQLDLDRFERRAEEAGKALARGDAREAADLLREALALWRGFPLDDVAFEPFAQAAIARLGEIRLAALELRIDAELALGRHTELVGELEELVTLNPLRERFRAQLMLALYRSGRQTEALELFRAGRQALVDQFGIEPGPALRDLERAILNQDSALHLAGAARRAEPLVRTVLVLPSEDGRLDPLLDLAGPLARVPGRELIVARLVADEAELALATEVLNANRPKLGAGTRTAVFTSQAPVEDTVRLADTHDVDLVIVDAPPCLDSDLLPAELAALLECSQADVGVVAGTRIVVGDAARLSVLFGGAEHDWAALELSAWLASAIGARLTLVGTRADPARGRRDASRLLADASLTVQRLAGVETEPLLADATTDALLAVVEQAGLVIVGMPGRWRAEGLGSTRRALVRDARPATLLVHGGARPGGLAPRETRTRFSWSIEVGAA